MSKSSLNVCLVAPLPPPYGGISHWTSMLCKYVENRTDVRISVVNTSPRWREIHDLTLWKRVIGGGLQCIRDAIYLGRLLSKSRFDAIHLTTSGQLAIIRDLGVLLVGRLFNVSIIYHIRFGRVPQIAAARNLEWLMMSWVMSNADTVIAIDGATRDTIAKYLPAANVELIPNCINLETLPMTAASVQPQFTAVYVGWVIPAKGITELIDAWSQLRLPGWRLHVIGPSDAVYRQKLIEQYGTDGIEFLGELSHDQAMKRMAAGEIFILPSYTEGFPNVILEAMALSKAIIATDVGAIPEMLAGECGLLVRPKDVRGLMTSLKALCGDGNLRDEMGKRARERVSAQYSIDTVFARYMTLWGHSSGSKRC